MNQILSTGDKQEKSNINNIVRIFCIIIIVFAIFFIIQGIYALVKDKNERAVTTGNKPEVVINSKGGSAIINVKSNNSISKLVYSWDNGEPMEIDAQNKTELEQEVVVPNGNCTLNIAIIDSNGVSSKYEQKFEYDPNVDVVMPEIKVSAIPGKITIEAKDNIEMAYITYKWNDEPEVKIEASGEDLSKIVQEIEVKKGTNTLKIVATDKAGNVAQDEKDIIGASKPKVSVGKSGSNLIIKVTDDDEVTKVEYKFNGTDYTKENTGENKKEFEFKQEMKQGENVIVIKAYNKSGLVQEFAGKATYQP
ncbi:MAG: hypothetical protein IJX34_00490 [Clostridia bacterium]|nr:hypothetical protein [Clostridia bacterium]